MRKILLLALPLLLLEARAASPVEQSLTPTPAGPVVSVSAEGGHITSVWFLDINAKGKLTTSATDTRPLTVQERDRLAALIKALPRQRAVYSFEGPYYVDATVGFELTVGTGNEKRRYRINGTFKDYAAHGEITPILEAMHFLRTLVLSKEAYVPPPVGGGLAK